MWVIKSTYSTQYAMENLLKKSKKDPIQPHAGEPAGKKFQELKLEKCT